MWCLFLWLCVDIGICQRCVVLVVRGAALRGRKQKRMRGWHGGVMGQRMMLCSLVTLLYALLWQPHASLAAAEMT